MSVHVFYNPELVEQLTSCGITRRRPAGAQGFVLGGPRGPTQPRQIVTNVIAVREGVTITGRRDPASLPTRPTIALPAPTQVAPQTALELVEDNDRLRRDNQRLADENARLRADVDRLTGRTQAKDENPDDSTQRFSLLELY